MDDMAKWSAASGGIVDSGVRVLGSGGGMVVMVVLRGFRIKVKVLV
ncbi:hypothetical protein Pint_26261 [Pistacia integerrima]|uniref:Uncharacterized protein n=1 Tax=Pistacia integerrima TaxID=434235 RepID=A0ACC0YCU5_9ROSI|nr:hypothetical protein Pint_26261 [Pistacia integerrima]